MSGPYDLDFEKFRSEQIKNQPNKDEFTKLTQRWVEASVEAKYSYRFDWLGVPIIQFPTDLIAFQEIVFNVRPTLIIECGVARGGSAVFWASMQELCGLTPNVVGVDIDIRDHAHNAVKNSRFNTGIHLVLGSSVIPETAAKVKQYVKPDDIVLLVLDSNHTHEHVLRELELYADLVSVNSFLLVLDTVIEQLPVDDSRPWGPGENPQTAVLAFMSKRDDFRNSKEIEEKIAITVAPNGFWQRLK